MSFLTGTLTAVIDGQERQLHSSASVVPADAADGVTDPQQRALLERVAGTEQHTATFKAMDAITMGGMQLVPAKIHVAIGARLDGEASTGIGGVDVRFSLDPATLELGAPEDIEVYYYPRGWGYDDYYALTEGALVLSGVEVVDQDTLAISGSVEGLLTHQSDYDVVHNPDEALPLRATFTIARVVGSGLVLELLKGE